MPGDVLKKRSKKSKKTKGENSAKSTAAEEAGRKLASNVLRQAGDPSRLSDSAPLGIVVLVSGSGGVGSGTAEESALVAQLTQAFRLRPETVSVVGVDSILGNHLVSLAHADGVAFDDDVEAKVTLPHLFAIRPLGDAAGLSVLPPEPAAVPPTPLGDSVSKATPVSPSSPSAVVGVGVSNGATEPSPAEGQPLHEPLETNSAGFSGVDSRPPSQSSECLIMTWGMGKLGRLGHGTDKNVGRPRAVVGLAGEHVVRVACGGQFTLALTRTGRVFAWGATEGGMTGLGHAALARPAVLEPEAISFPEGGDSQHAVVSLAAGFYHAAAVDASGNCYVWGRAEHGRLGNGVANRDEPAPNRVALVGPGGQEQLAYSVACGGYHTLMIDLQGNAYACGVGWDGRLGLTSTSAGDDASGTDDAAASASSAKAAADGAEDKDDREVSAYVPRPIPFLTGRRVAGVSCGWSHSLAVCADGSVFAWGRNAAGQLGVGDEKSRPVPTPVMLPLTATGPSPTDSVAAMAHDSDSRHHHRTLGYRVDCGGLHSAVVSVSGTLFTFGSARNGELGHGKAPCCRPGPVEVDAHAFRSLLPPESASRGIGADSHGSQTDAPDGTADRGSAASGKQPMWHWRKLLPRTASSASDPDFVSNLAEAGYPSADIPCPTGHKKAIQCWPRAVCFPSMPGSADRPSVVSVACGSQHTMVELADGRLFAFGDGDYGVLGVGSSKHANVPVQVMERPLTHMACGFAHTAAVLVTPLTADQVNQSSLPGQMGSGAVAGGSIRRPSALGSARRPIVAVADAEKRQMALDAASMSSFLRSAYKETLLNRSKANILVSGISGGGKSSIINSVFGAQIASVGAGRPVTQHFQLYEPADKPVLIYDSRGLEVGRQEEFVTETRQFLLDHSLSNKGEGADIVHVVWYVIDASVARVQPFELEICRTLFQHYPVIFILNKADIVSPADIRKLTEAIENEELENCVGIIATVTASSSQVYVPSHCPRCKSDDVSYRKKRKELVCDNCGFVHIVSMSIGLDEVVRLTMDKLPVLARESFIAAQSLSDEYRESASAEVLRLFFNEVDACRSRLNAAAQLMTLTCDLISRLCVLWNFESHADLYGALTTESAYGSKVVQSSTPVGAAAVAAPPPSSRIGGAIMRKLTRILPIGLKSSDVQYAVALGVLWAVCLEHITKSLAAHAAGLTGVGIVSPSATKGQQDTRLAAEAAMATHQIAIASKTAKPSSKKKGGRSHGQAAAAPKPGGAAGAAAAAADEEDEDLGELDLSFAERVVNETFSQYYTEANLDKFKKLLADHGLEEVLSRAFGSISRGSLMRSDGSSLHPSVSAVNLAVTQAQAASADLAAKKAAAQSNQANGVPIQSVAAYPPATDQLDGTKQSRDRGDKDGSAGETFDGGALFSNTASYMRSSSPPLAPSLVVDSGTNDDEGEDGDSSRRRHSHATEGDHRPFRHHHLSSRSASSDFANARVNKAPKPRKVGKRVGNLLGVDTTDDSTTSADSTSLKTTSTRSGSFSNKKKKKSGGKK